MAWFEKTTGRAFLYRQQPCGGAPSLVAADILLGSRMLLIARQRFAGPSESFLPSARPCSPEWRRLSSK
jgi:hypothetical protein